MVRWRLKSCPRCGGDILIDKDLDNWYEQCLQCSYRKELEPVRPYKEPVSVGEGVDKEADSGDAG
jgi:ribosomal protein S27AE